MSPSLTLHTTTSRITHALEDFPNPIVTRVTFYPESYSKCNNDT